MGKIRYEWEELDWEDDEPLETSHRFQPPRLPTRWLLGIFFSAALVVLASWFLNMRRQELIAAALMQEVQTILDLERSAFLAGDGELFFAQHISDEGWRAAQLTPANLAIIRSGQTVTTAQQQGELLWAEASWTAQTERYHRLLFFQHDGQQWQRTPAGNPYWGPRRTSSQSWGVLSISRADALYEEAISSFITAELARLGQLCDNCPTLTITIAPDLTPTALKDHIRLPSPRLVGLTETGVPAPHYWELVAEQLRSHLSNTTITFAVPLFQLQFYESIVAEFHQRQHQIQVELVTLDQLPSDPLMLLAQVDGAATTPHNSLNILEPTFTLTDALLAAGAVVDLTDLATSDPAFAAGDFYEQIWRGGLWQGRFWLVPQSAYLPVIFYDKAAYELTERPYPSLGWTWAEMLTEINYLSQTQPAWIRWGLADQRADLLYAYAHTQTSNCGSFCTGQLTPTAHAAALDWYLALLKGPNGRAGLGPLHHPRGPNQLERLSAALTVVSTRRQAAFWVEDPARFEYHLLLNSLGVLPFPASDEFNSSTPLWVQGSVISSASPQPLATWAWLRFLSFRQVNAGDRLIPARPSVANQTGFWTSLPREVDSAMRTAFPFARPITFTDQKRFSWAQIDALVDGALTVTEASSPQNLRWFQNAQP